MPVIYLSWGGFANVYAHLQAFDLWKNKHGFAVKQKCWETRKVLKDRHPTVHWKELRRSQNLSNSRVKGNPSLCQERTQSWLVPCWIPGISCQQDSTPPTFLENARSWSSLRYRNLAFYKSFKFKLRVTFPTGLIEVAEKSQGGDSSKRWEFWWSNLATFHPSRSMRKEIQMWAHFLCPLWVCKRWMNFP